MRAWAIVIGLFGACVGGGVLVPTVASWVLDIQSFWVRISLSVGWGVLWSLLCSLAVNRWARREANRLLVEAGQRREREDARHYDEAP